MKVSSAITILCLCVGTLMAGSVYNDSLVISAVIHCQQMKKIDDPHSGKASRGRSAVSLARDFYEKIISSQDGNTCCFSVSCSNFCVSMVRDKGMVKGALLTADRLTRCNGIQVDRYEIDSLSGKNVDDVPGLVK